jgi:zinc protease
MPLTPAPPSPARALLLSLLALGCAATADRPLVPEVAAPAAPPDVRDAPAPLYAGVHAGKLSNGLQYYVLAHGAPEKRAVLWLAVDVGSIFEADDERGYAHFVEHMAFEGTRRFPKREIISFVERVGMTFGPDANAFTTYDQTVYELTVPTNDPSIAATGLDMLRDVAGDVTFDAAAVAHQKDIVLEERRMRRSAADRAAEAERALLFQGSRYADRTPIGTPESIGAATRERLATFYRRWYRPGAMAVIAVGDFDPRAMEAEIRARFGDLTNPTAAPAAPGRALPHDGRMRIGLLPDAEARTSSVTVFDLEDRPWERTKRDYRARRIERLYDVMEDARLAELRDNRGSPIEGSEATRRNLSRTAVAHVRKVIAKEGHVRESLELLFREIAQLGRYGFLQSELERARNELISRDERNLSEWDSSPLSRRAAEILRLFTEQEALPGPQVELEWTHELVPSITLDEVNALARARAVRPSRVVAIAAPGGLPSEAEVMTIASYSAFGPLSPWTDKVPGADLLAVRPTPDRIVGEARDAAADATVWTLSNGIRVVFKRTDFLKDSVGLWGWQWGGTSRATDVEFPSARFASEIVMASGAGPFSARELNKLTAGRRMSVSIGISELGDQIRADATPENLETMLQLLTLRLLHGRRDTWAFENWKGKLVEGVRHRADSPDQRFIDEAIALASGDHPRRRPVSSEMIGAIDGAMAYDFWRRELAELGGFTFVFVGNVAPERLRPAVETYLASLPGSAVSRSWANIGVVHPSGKVEKTVVAGHEPRSLVWLSFGAPVPFSFDAERDAVVLQTLLRIRLRERLRDEMGMVYGVGALAYVGRAPEARQTLSISFPCAPANVERAREAVFAELAELGRNGPDARLLATVSEQLRRARERERRENRWWLARLQEAYIQGDDFGKANDLDALLARVTAADVRATVARLYDEKRYLFAVLRPDVAPATPAPGPAAAPRDEP